MTALAHRSLDSLEAESRDGFGQLVDRQTDKMLGEEADLRLTRCDGRRRGGHENTTPT